MRRALSFLTPLGGAVVPSPSALAWFPAVGACLGLALGGVWWLADRLWAAPVSAAVVVAVDLALTGMLHFDGLVDSADGLLPPLERGRRLEVMADPSAGAFGVGVAVVVLLLRWASLATLAPAPWLLAALWSTSRLAMALVAQRVPYARPGGLAGAFLDGGRRLPVAGVLLAGVLATVAGGDGVAGVVVLGLVAAGVVALAVRRLGGFTGDVLGAAGVLGETAGLLAAAARW